MENIKVKFTNMSERDEIQRLFTNLGYNFVNNIACEKGFVVASLCSSGINFDYWADVKEISLQYLRDLVVLKRNDVNDATHICGLSKVLKLETKDYKIWDATYNIWVDYIGSQTDFRRGLKQIEKEVKMKEKEYIAKVSGDWRFVESHELVSGRIEVPEEAEIFLLDKSFGEDTLYFVKHDGDVFHEYYINATDVPNNTWIKGTIKELHKCMGEVLWERNLTKTDTSIQEKLKSINKEKEVKMKEYLDKEYRIRKVKQTSGDDHVPKGWIDVPEGAEEYRSNRRFYKNNGKMFYATYGEWGEWVESGLPNYETLWQRNHTTTLDSKNTSIQEKLKFIEKWLNGEKIQYILGVESDKTQWHNFTEGAMQYIKRSDIKFREAPKYVTINGIEFKSVERLLKHVKNNFDLEDGE